MLMAGAILTAALPLHALMRASPAVPLCASVR